MSEEQEGKLSQNSESNPSFNPNNPFAPQGFGMGFGGMQQALPNATAVLVLGILSIITCCCFYGLPSLILGIIALVLSKKDMALYIANVGAYTEGSYKNLKAGRVCAIIGLVFSALIIIACIIFVSLFGFEMLNDQEAMKEWLEQLQNQ